MGVSSGRMRGGGLLVAAAMAGLVAVPAGQQVFRATTDVVLLPVTVTSRGDALVAGLTREQFQVTEDGQAQSVSFFSVGASPDVPLHLGLLLDTSGSMQRELSGAETAAIRFINTLTEARDVTFVDFSEQVRISRFFPESYPHLFERIRANTADGYTALYDAAAMYLSVAEEQPGQKVLLLYTDGADSRSETTYSELVEMLRLSQVMVYVIGYLDSHLSTEKAMAQMRMNDIAHQTGGAAFYPSGKNDLDRIYGRILDELAGRYTLGYVSTNTAKDGTWRKLQIKVDAAEVRGLKVRSRPGYFAPITRPPPGLPALLAIK
jgi:Ca-activated chloride channel family protein